MDTVNKQKYNKRELISLLFQGKRKLAVGLIVLLIPATIFAASSFSTYLKQHLFEERNDHLMEVTEKLTMVMDTVVDTSWSLIRSYQNTFLQLPTESTEDVLDALHRCHAFVLKEEQSSLLLAIDQKA